MQAIFIAIIMLCLFLDKLFSINIFKFNQLLYLRKKQNQLQLWIDKDVMAMVIYETYTIDLKELKIQQVISECFLKILGLFYSLF